MSSVRIWAVESDYDEKAVKELATKLAAHLEVELTIRTAGRAAYNAVRKPEQLERAVEIYLKESNCVIFVIDTDSKIALQEKRQHRNSLITQIEGLVNSGKFNGRIYLAQTLQELEAWLLIDCMGICCYFARFSYRQNCRDKIAQNSKLKRLINKYQKGDTTLIVEPSGGGKGAKEYLEKFSEEILKILNSGKTNYKIFEHAYDESTAPEVAKFIEINNDTLRRNASLQHLGQLLARCC